MAWRLRSSVVRGEIDNRVRGRISGKIWLVGRDDPVELKLEGNGYRDVAGCLFIFENPNPQAGDEHTDLFSGQVGAIGDYTASRKVRAFDIPIDEALEMIRRGEKPPEHMANCLYLEWFSERNGRVVIESHDYKTRIADTAWVLDEEGEREQFGKNAEAMVGFMQRLGEAVEMREDDGDPPYDPADDQPMDEFAWERFMKESDERTDKLGKLLEKYMDDPNRDEVVAREMGWDGIPDLFGDLPEVGLFDFDEGELEEPVPNPLTEGKDWVWDKHGYPAHPLQIKASETVMELWHECEEAGLFEGNAGSDDLHEMLFNGQCVGIKLAGALNSLAYDHVPDSGFVVASLKRSLPYFDKMMRALEKVGKRELVSRDRLGRFSTDMFAIRAEIVELMDRFRSEFRG